MPGSIIKRKTGLFIVFDAGRQYRNGKWVRVQKWEKVEGGRREAEKQLALRVSEVHRGQFVDLKPILAAELVSRWWEAYAVVHLRVSTRRKNRHLLDGHLLPAFGSLPVQAITSEAMEQFKAERLQAGLSPRYVGHMVALWRQILHAGVRWGYLRANPCQHITKPPVRGEVMRCLSPAQTQALLREGGRWTPLYRLAVTTGMRLGELLAMKWCYLDWDRRRYRVEETLLYNQKRIFGPPKTDGSRASVVLTPTSMEELRSAFTPERELIFPSSRNTPINPRNVVLRHFEPALRRAGLPRIRFHDLRHTAASLMIHQGLHAKAVQRQMRHSSITMTYDTYGHLFPEALEVGMDGLDAALSEG